MFPFCPGGAEARSPLPSLTGAMGSPRLKLVGACTGARPSLAGCSGEGSNADAFWGQGKGVILPRSRGAQGSLLRERLSCTEEEEEEKEEGRGSCWPETAAASAEHLHVQFHNRIKAVVLERRDGSVGQVYTRAYTEGIAVYFLTLLGLTCGAVQMRLCKATPSGKMGGKSGTRR